MFLDDFAEFLSFKDPELAKLADLLLVPKELRTDFIRHVGGFTDYVNPPDGAIPNAVCKDSAALKKAEFHVRGLIEALKDVNAADAKMLYYAWNVLFPGQIYFKKVDIDNAVAYERASISDILHPMAKGIAYLIGRDAEEPKVRDWRLNALLRDIQTWPERFGAVGIADTRSKTLEKAIGILNEMMPDIVPAEIKPSTIKTIWKPRPKKGRKR